MAISQNQNSHSKRPGIPPGRFAFCTILFGLLLLYSGAKAGSNSLYSNEFVILHTLSNGNLTDIDSTDKNSMVGQENSTSGENGSTEDELDDLEAELDAIESDTLEPDWSFSLGTKYRSQEQRNGVDISNGLPTLGSSFDVSHTIGLAFEFNTSHRIAKSNLDFQDYSFGLNYDYSAADWVDIALGFTRTKYQSDTTNALAGSSLTISLTTDFYIKKLILDLALDRYTGEDASTALSLSAIYPIRYKDLSITPMFSTSLLSYEITTKRLKALAKANKTTPKTKKALSLSSVVVSVPMSYPIYKGLSFNFTPTYSYSPIETVASNRTQFVANIGIKYSIDL